MKPAISQLLMKLIYLHVLFYFLDESESSLAIVQDSNKENVVIEKSSIEKIVQLVKEHPCNSVPKLEYKHVSGLSYDLNLHCQDCLETTKVPMTDNVSHKIISFIQMHCITLKAKRSFRQGFRNWLKLSHMVQQGHNTLITNYCIYMFHKKQIGGPSKIN